MPVARQLLNFKNLDSLVKFRLCLRLSLPTAVLRLLTSPTHQMGAQLQMGTQLREELRTPDTSPSLNKSLWGQIVGEE
jgi:hypothetical protein